MLSKRVTTENSKMIKIEKKIVGYDVAKPVAEEAVDKPEFKREGGSVPVVNHIKEILGVETVNCGFSLPDDNFHSPNEKIHLPTWYNGIDTLIHFFYNLGE